MPTPSEQGAQTATPKTDAYAAQLAEQFECHASWVQLPPDFARDLERDNARLASDCERMRKALEGMLASFGDGATAIVYRGKPGAFDAATQHIAAARAALRDAGQA